MSNLWDLIPTPPDDTINTGFSPARQSTMIALLGKPRQRLTVDCSPVTNKELRKLLVTRSVGPFRVTGLNPAVEAVQMVMRKVRDENPDVYYSVRTAGMLCCRAVRGSKTNWSNHSWGSAIDLYFGDHIDRMDDGKTQVGLLELYPYFRAVGFYWGAEFSREDSMHWEASDQLVRDWKRQGLLG
jgi:hypothetical protein